MKKISFTFLLFFISTSYAQDNLAAHVTYTNPEKFIDFETQLGSQDRAGRLKKDLSKNINRIWEKFFANGYSLTIDFIDIDMAGRILFGIEQIREVRVDLDRSVLEFDFTIKDENGKTIKSGHERLTNNNLARLARMDRNQFRMNRSRLRYEVAQLEEWIEKLSKELG